MSKKKAFKVELKYWDVCVKLSFGYCKHCTSSILSGIKSFGFDDKCVIIANQTLHKANRNHSHLKHCPTDKTLVFIHHQSLTLL